jgi:sporulation protein YlmC with PRC-barrel domain
MQKHIALVSLLGLGLATAAAAQDQPAHQPPSRSPNLPPASKDDAPPSTPARGSQLLGVNIVGASDQKLGEITELVLTGPSEITAVVLREHGGFICLPLSALQPQLARPADERDRAPPTTRVERFLFPGENQDFFAAEAASSPDQVDAAMIQRARSQFVETTKAPGQSGPRAGDAGAAQPPARSEGDRPDDKGDVHGADDDAPGEQHPTSGNTGAGSAAGTANSSGNGPGAIGGPLATDGDSRLASATKPLGLRKLLGRDVKDESDRAIGDVKDIAVDLARSEVAYVIVSVGGLDGMLRGASLDMFQSSESGRTVRLPVPPDTSRSPGSGLDLDRLPMQPLLLSLSARDAADQRR